ncbi:MAG TPA: hypothetical protein VN648_18620, partial [Candidatus Methylomirabilis sp.]|nr:hypothetical protein [Candidatus Methylomirabilis sp.]
QPASGNRLGKAATRPRRQFVTRIAGDPGGDEPKTGEFEPRTNLFFVCHLSILLESEHSGMRCQHLPTQFGPIRRKLESVSATWLNRSAGVMDFRA